MEPTMTKDAQGEIVAGAHTEPITLFDQAVRAFCPVYSDPLSLVDAALKISPDFAMAHLTKAWMLALPNDPGLASIARKIIDGADGLAMNERERAHHAAVELAAAGSRRAAVAVLDRHLMSHPLDIVAHLAAAF